ncbi:DUF4180 domain-containing protein [Chromobacterium sp. IIBBL 290-4]|uniref:DUF4180 domain-containing protein n=1 Tax=Chromobacterium sp. IIBBL 290-4 TaxID=2953890 RepID=UPI0020B649A0|nr:DUF4180 domain-containing protein [Chromobacterium sp. IIBBL 290-4]UTH74521.1 DUF4180 domain-containing protein [Chromobacterium sp. IIBBL 290-4]
MTYQILRHETGRVLEWEAPLRAADQATELISACIEQDCRLLLLSHPVLPADFFELSTRFAGEFLQKLQNYRLRTAVVIDPERDYGERFGEYLREARRARYSRLFFDRAAALAWLDAENS